jgi:hypothetical protein
MERLGPTEEKSSTLLGPLFPFCDVDSQFYIHKSSISLFLFPKLFFSLEKSLMLVPIPFNFWELLEAQWGKKKISHLFCL